MAKNKYDVKVSGIRNKSTKVDRLYTNVFAETKTEAERIAKERFKTLFKDVVNLIIDSKQKK